MDFQPTQNGYIVKNQFSDLIDGLLQGHQLGLQLHRQQQEDQAFKTNQALHEQQMSVQDIMNRQMLQENARPVTAAGTVASPAGPVAPSGVPGGGDFQAPAYQRKADSARTVKYGGGQYELKTPEEQQQGALDSQIKTQSALELAKGEQGQRVRESVLKMRGVPVPEDIATALRLPAGSMALPEEIPGLAEHVDQIRKGNMQKLGPGDTLVDTTPGAAPGGGGAPGARVVASGGPPNPTGEFASVYLPKFAQSLGKTPAQLSEAEVSTALGRFKEANADPEVRAATLASKAASQATADLARTMKQMQIGQQPTQEDAARMADHILNHELAPSQISEIRGRGNGALGMMIEREMAKKDPHFSWQQADSDYAYSKSPALQNTVRYMDAAMGSMGRLQTAADTLNNGQIRSINSLTKLGKNQFNNIDLKRFQTDVTLVGDEIGKIMQGGGTGSGVSDGKLKQAQEIFKDTDSPKAIATALKEVQSIIGYRRAAVTRGTFLENAPVPEGGGSAAGGQSSYAHTATGPNGHKIGSNDGKAWFDLQTGQAVK